MATFDLPPLLIKFGDEKDINKFVNEGSMKFGTYEEYRRVPSDPLLQNLPGRYDSLEGLSKSMSGKTNITFKDRNISIELKDAQLNLFQQEYKNLFCAYGASHNVPNNFSIDPRMKEYFGGYAVVFNSKSFLQHIHNLLSGTKFHMGYVKYYPDQQFYQNLGPYSKREIYQFQYEYRIATNLSNQILNIGDFLKCQPDTYLVDADVLLKGKFARK